MGGSIRFVFRDVDGTVHIRNVWTNFLPIFFADPRLINKDRAFIEETILSVPLDGNESVSPVEYGIVVLDWKLNKLSYCNSYSSFGYLFTTYFTHPHIYSGKDEIIKITKSLHGEGRLISIVDGNTMLGRKNGINLDLSRNSYDEVLTKIRGTDTDDFPFCYVKFDIGLTVIPYYINFDENIDIPMTKLVDQLISDGFTINQNEWSDYILTKNN